jgi:hypothetical protein
MRSGASTTVVSAADAGYFDLLRGLVLSLQQGSQSRLLALSILDLGMSPEQKQWLEAGGAVVVDPGWDVDFAQRDRAPAYYKAMTARPYLPKHFPGHDVYLWIDADAWVQDDSVLDIFQSGARRGKLAIVPELDRGYWTIHKRPKSWGQNQKAYAFAYGLAAGYRLGRTAILNSGAFALAGNAPHWRLWSEALARALNRRRIGGIGGRYSRRFHVMEQTALNYVVYAEHAPATFLPAYCNWFCGKGTPMYDPERRLLVEPHEPHRPIGIVHLAGKRMKERVWQLATPAGDTVSAQLTFEALRALA